MQATFTSKLSICLLLILSALCGTQVAYSQCSVSAAPSYSSGCTAEYFTSLSAFGTGVTSTISVGGISSCTGTYFNDYLSQGVTAPAGSTVTFNINRVSCTYIGYITTYVDWNNDGIYETTELSGSMLTLTSFVTSGTYSFTIPTSGLVAGVNLHMRLFLNELTSGAPCSGNYGQAYDFYIHVTCPAVSVSVSPATSTICAGTSEVLTASGAGIGGSYTWSTATGLSASTGSVVTASPITTIVYTVTGTTSISCSATTTTTVTVNPTPSAAVTASGSLGLCTGGSVTLTAAFGAGYTYQWQDGSTAIGGATDISYTASTAGNYSVIVTTGLGCSATSSVSAVTVSTIPTILASPASASICLGAVQALAGSGAGLGGSYTWSPGAGLSSTVGAFVSASPVATTVYTVTGTTAAGCISTATASVTVNPVPPSTVTQSGPLTFCSGSGVVFYAPTGAGLTYQWRNGAGAIAGATDTAYTALVSGTYGVKITNGFGCNATSAAFVVTANPLPDATITFSGGITFCSGGSVMLSAVAAAGNTYQWKNAGIAIAGATNASYTANTTGAYTVFITSPLGCSAESATIIATQLAPPVIVPASDTTFCMGGDVILTANVAGLAGVIYQWQLNGTDMAGANTGAWAATASGLYTCIISIPGSCTDTTRLMRVTVNPTPHPAVTFDGRYFHTAAYYTSYQWYINTVAIPGATASSVLGLNNGSYIVRIVDTNGCTAFSPSYIVNNLSVANTPATDNIKIYPNPATNTIHISAPMTVDAVVTGMEGKVMATQNNAHDMDISKLPPGIYLITLNDETGHRILVQQLVKN